MNNHWAMKIVLNTHLVDSQFRTNVCFHLVLQVYFHFTFTLQFEDVAMLQRQ